jgi:hypothetical protein
MFHAFFYASKVISHFLFISSWNQMEFLYWKNLLCLWLLIDQNYSQTQRLHHTHLFKKRAYSLMMKVQVPLKHELSLTDYMVSYSKGQRVNARYAFYYACNVCYWQTWTPLHYKRWSDDHQWHTHMHACTNTHTHARTHIHTRTHPHARACTHTHTHVRAHTNTHHTPHTCTDFHKNGTGLAQ